MRQYQSFFDNYIYVSVCVCVYVCASSSAFNSVCCNNFAKSYCSPRTSRCPQRAASAKRNRRRSQLKAATAGHREFHAIAYSMHKRVSRPTQRNACAFPSAETTNSDSRFLIPAKSSARVFVSCFGRAFDIRIPRELLALQRHASATFHATSAMQCYSAVS